MDNVQLILSFKKKDIAAFEKLYELYAVNICGVIHSIVKNPKLAQEVTNDVFVKIWNNSEFYDESKGRFFTWIVKIARNSAIDVLRSKSFRQDINTLSFDDCSYNQVGEVDEMDTSEVPSIRTILPLLNFKHTQIIELIYFQGYTHQQVADELSIPLGTVKFRNGNCIAKLKGVKKLQDWFSMKYD